MRAIRKPIKWKRYVISAVNSIAGGKTGRERDGEGGIDNRGSFSLLRRFQENSSPPKLVNKLLFLSFNPFNCKMTLHSSTINVLFGCMLDFMHLQLFCLVEVNILFTDSLFQSYYNFQFLANLQNVFIQLNMLRFHHIN